MPMSNVPESEKVTLKVHLSDASTHQPLGGATIELFANHTPVTTETSAADGNAYLRFPYHLGTLLVVTATRQGYVPNSAPWRPTRLPVFSSVSLELLPERAATLMVYEDLIQINSGSQGERERERVLRHCPSDLTHINNERPTHTGRMCPLFLCQSFRSNYITLDKIKLDVIL
uniref:FAM171 N-terminal domain-containing protein n=1 Tax=Hucho hucho TaxID=62062 RepID=A0A4W5JZI2_9TELE